jgi:uncharacterized protein YukE
MANSTDQNIQWAKTFAAGAQHATKGGEDGDGFVRFSDEAWHGWNKAIQAFIDDIDKHITPHIAKLNETYKGVGNYSSATDTRILLRDTAPEEVKQAIDKYKDYLVELQKGLKAAHDRLRDVDGG